MLGCVLASQVLASVRVGMCVSLAGVRVGMCVSLAGLCSCWDVC